MSRQGPADTVAAIRDALISVGADVASQIRALELLMVTLPPAETKALIDTICEDARALRRSLGGGQTESVRITALRDRRRSLEAQLAELARARPEQAEARRRIEALGSVERTLAVSAADLTRQRDRLASLLARLSEEPIDEH